MAVSGGSTVVLKPAMRCLWPKGMFLYSIWGVSDNKESAIFCVKIRVGQVKKNV